MSAKCQLSPVLYYGIALLAVGLVTIIRLLMDPYVGDSVPYAPYSFAVAVTIWLTRSGPSLFAIFLSAFAGDWFFLPPRYSFYTPPAHLLAELLFIGANLLFLAMANAMRKAMASEEANAKAARQEREEARQQREEMKAIVEGVPAAIWQAHNRDCRHMIGNKETQKLLELAPGANASKTAPEREGPQHYDFYVDGQLVPDEQLPIQTAARTGQALLDQELEIRFTNGNRKWIYGNAVPLKSQTGEVFGAVGAFIDVTARREMEMQLAKAQLELKQYAHTLEQRVAERTAKLQEMVAELEHFSYSITHDMRAPLRAMVGLTQILSEASCHECPNSLSKEYHQRIMKAALRMDRLIVDALNYTKVVRSELPLETVDVANLLRDIIEGYPNLERSKADIRVEGEFPPVKGNVSALTECFSNLLGNAVKFVAPGVFPRVRVWAEPRNGLVRIWLEDNGIGIPRGKEDRIFDMFQRMSADYEGTGIGLAIVRKAAERMGGKVGVESEPGKGSRFWLELQPTAQQDSLLNSAMRVFAGK